MKINHLDAHDRLKYLKSDQGLNIGKTCQDIINQRPFGDHNFYIFAHKRQIGLDERVSMYNQDLTAFSTVPSYQRLFNQLGDVPTDRIIWQPRLTKPKAQTNSMLFKAYVGTDNVRVIWIIPPEEMWDQFKKGNLTENKTVVESIYDYQNNPRKLEAKEEDDLDDKTIMKIYNEISQNKNKSAFWSKQQM